MAGAWELQRQSVLCVILHTEMTTIAWSLGFRNLIIPGGILPVTGLPFDHARNVGAREALRCGASHLFYLDSDVIPPKDAILRLLSRNQPIISGLYCRRSPPHSIPVCMRPTGRWITEINGPIMEVDVVGAGCLLIHRGVLEKLPPLDPNRGKTHFDWRVDMGDILPPGNALSEDFSFCKQVREKLGIKILVDTTVRCRHVGMAEATYGQFVPLDTNRVD